MTGARADMQSAVADMIRVLDVVDAMHADAPGYAATMLAEMGPERTAEAALRLLDVIVHVIIADVPGGTTVTAEMVTDYIRENLGGSDV